MSAAGDFLTDRRFQRFVVPMSCDGRLCHVGTVRITVSGGVSETTMMPFRGTGQLGLIGDREMQG